MNPERIGLIGGTFDPIHIGHLVIADRAREQLELNRVVFLPAGVQPHKKYRKHAPAADRLAMVECAIRGNPAFACSDRDIRPEGPSYTVDLLREFKEDHPTAELVFIIGGDSLRDFPTWHNPEGIVDLTNLAVAERPEARVPDSVYQQVRGLRQAVVRLDAPLLDISATDLRQRIAANLSIRYLVPDAVHDYIRQNRLYRP